MKNYVSYYRVSKDSHKAGKSKSRGLGLDAQKQIVTNYFGDKIVKEFTEVKSGGNITDRKELQKAIQYCLENNCWLVVAKLDRLSRNTEDLLYIWNKLNRKISFCDIPTEGEVDKFTITLYVAFSEREREIGILRTRQALEQKKKRVGEWRTGNNKINQFSKKGTQSIIEKAKLNSNNKKAFGYICQLKNSGKNYIEIAEILNKEDFKTSKGNLFFPMQVKRLYDRHCVN